MAVYVYKAIDRQGNIVFSEVTAENVAFAVRKIQRGDRRIISITEKKTPIWEWLQDRLSSGKIDDQSLAVFTRQLATMIKVGIPFSRALKTLYADNPNKRLQDVVKHIDFDIQQGLTVANAFAKHDKVFSEVYISMLRVGQSTGMLPDVLARLATYVEKDVETQHHVKAALTYPVFIFIMAIGAVVAMMIFFVPQFLGIYTQMGMALPLPTKILIGITKMWTNPLLLMGMLSSIGFVLFLITSYIKTPAGKYQFDELMLMIPVVGQLNICVIVARFCRSLETMYITGLPMVQSLEIAEGIVGNEVFKEVVKSARDAVKEGSYLSSYFKGQKYIPRIVGDMIYIGEHTGELNILLNKLANMYEVEVQYAMESVLAMFEPLLIAFLSVAIGFIVISIFLPLYGIIGSLTA
ncbi:MAG: type II secretion system F family protein [bacterium]